MRCDNFCPRCGDPEESVTHAIFECPPALQVWALSGTPSCPNIFPVSSIYANMDYLFWRKDNIAEANLDRDAYPWLIWYIWKARNDKLFRGIDRDPMELVRYAESECQAWFNANERVQSSSIELSSEIPQVLSLRDICLIDGSWISTAPFSGCGWVWMGNQEKVLLMGTRNFAGRESALHSEVEALCWAMEHEWPSFATELERIETLKTCFPDFKIAHIPRTQNGIADLLARTARSFHRELCFIGCFIPVWLPRPPLV
ncbi:hypothetical protein N665_4879s0001 [Sinapis alba]|nr:hypothetical protein N665_4879s0001 [Sinapis alba]